MLSVLNGIKTTIFPYFWGILEQSIQVSVIKVFILLIPETFDFAKKSKPEHKIVYFSLQKWHIFVVQISNKQGVKKDHQQTSPFLCIITLLCDGWNMAYVLGKDTI